jgi:hypothetical protein
MNIQKNIKEVKTSTSLLQYENNILYTRIYEYACIDEEEMKEQFKAREELVKDDKYAVLVDARNFNTTTEGARKFLAGTHQPKRIAMAVLTNNLAVTLLANFYLKVNKPNTPTRIFNKEENAVKWLREELEKQL